MKTTLTDVSPYITRDQSEIRELMHPDQHSELGVRNQSLAQACVLPAQETQLHQHHRSEEIYFIQQGSGQMQLGEKQLAIQAGDSICIPPGTPHKLINTGNVTLHVLCCCSPPYAHEDTQLLDP